MERYPSEVSAGADTLCSADTTGPSVDGKVAPLQVFSELMTRLNAKLEAADLEPMTDLVKDFSNGVKLIQVSLSCGSLAGGHPADP